MNLEKIKNGHAIQVEELNKRSIQKIVKLTIEALSKAPLAKTDITTTLLLGEHDTIDYYVMYRSEIGNGGLEQKLNEWLDEKPYYTQELDDEEKIEFINEKIESYVWENDKEWLNDELGESENEYGEPEENDYYSDINLSEIVNTIYDMFANANTKYEIEKVLEENLGHYSNSILTKVDGMYYLIFEI